MANPYYVNGFCWKTDFCPPKLLGIGIRKMYMSGGMVVMHVFNSSFWLRHNFDNNLYYNPLTVNHLFIFIMSRVVDDNKVQLDLAFKKLFKFE